MRLSWVFAIVHGGCGLLFPLDERSSPAIDGPAEDAASDGKSSDGSDACPSAMIEEDYDDDQRAPCGGALPLPADSTGLMRENGLLAMTPANGGANSVSCTTATFAFDVAGIEVTEIGGIGTFTQIAVRTLSDSFALDIRHEINGTKSLQMTENGIIVGITTYEPTQMRFLRLAASSNGLVVGQLSPDGGNYGDFKTSSLPAPTMATATIETGTTITTNTPGTARVDNLITCRR